VPHEARYTVTKELLRYWRGRYGEVPACRLCDRVFVAGDDVLSRALQRSGFSRRRYYHARCFEEGSVPRRKYREQNEVSIRS